MTQPHPQGYSSESPARAALTALRHEVGKAVVGQEAAVTSLVIALVCRGHVLLEGVPGTAKTLLVRSFSKALQIETKRVQFTPDLMPGDITGSLIYDSRTAQFAFREGPVFTNLMLADEINRTPPKTQAALLEAMEERQVTVDGTPRPLPDPFIVAATQNPVEYEGTYPLPEAQLDRFLMKIRIDLPARDAEIEVLNRHAHGFDPRDLDAAGLVPVAGPQDLAQARREMSAVIIHPQVLAYIVDVVRATRMSPSLQLGVSPRGATAIMNTARAWAWLSGRDYVSPDDVKALAFPTLRHRVALRPEAELEGVTTDSVIESILATVPVPADGFCPRVLMVLTRRAGILAAASVLVVAVIGSWWGVLIAALVLAAVIGTDVFLTASPSKVHARRSGDTSVRLGQIATTQLMLTNTGGKPVNGVVRDSWTPSAGARHGVNPVVIPARQRRALTLTLLPTRRGDRRAGPVVLRVLGPMRIAGRQAELDAPWTVRALPPFNSRKHLPSRLARLRELDGRSTILQRGQGTEFDSLREYVPGDDVRSIDWRGTARSTTVVVKTWRPERDRHVLIVLDSGRTSAGRVGDQPKLDHSMDAALLLAALASRAGDRVDLLIADRDVRASVLRKSAAEILPSFVNAMALIEPVLVETDYRELVTEITQRISQRSLIVFLTAVDPAAVTEGLVPVLGPLRRRHKIVVAAVSDPRVDALLTGREDVGEVYAAAAAESDRGRRADTARQLRELGLSVVQAPPDRFAPDLADHYLALKKSGLL